MGVEMFWSTETSLLVTLVKDLGFPASVAFVVLYGGWELIRFLINSHKELIDQVKTALDKQSSVLMRHSEALESLVSSQKEFVTVQKKMLSMIEGKLYEQIIRPQGGEERQV